MAGVESKDAARKRKRDTEDAHKKKQKKPRKSDVSIVDDGAETAVIHTNGTTPSKAAKTPQKQNAQQLAQEIFRTKESSAQKLAHDIFRARGSEETSKAKKNKRKSKGEAGEDNQDETVVEVHVATPSKADKQARKQPAAKDSLVVAETEEPQKKKKKGKKGKSGAGVDGEDTSMLSLDDGIPPSAQKPRQPEHATESEEQQNPKRKESANSKGGEDRNAATVGAAATQERESAATVHTAESEQPQKSKKKKSGRKSQAGAVNEVDDTSMMDIDVATPARKEATQITKDHPQQKNIKEENKSLVVEVLDDGSNTQVSHSKLLSKKNKKVKAPWTVSEPTGGWFLPHDPIFSADGKYLFLANSQALRVYATGTSLLSHTLPVGSGKIAAYTLSSTNPNQLYIANSSGLISLWDWTAETKVARWDIGNKIRQMVSITRSEVPHDLLYCHEAGSHDTINVHSLRTGKEAAQTELKQILKTKSQIKSFQVLFEGRAIVVCSENSITVGKPVNQKWTSLKELAYTWREFQVPRHITAFHAQFRPRPDQPVSHQAPVDVAVGDKDGAIHLFEDIWYAFAKQEKRLKEGEKVKFASLAPKRLHWHRDAVGSVKWSHDGNYVISGGKETVLVIWQLSTGNQQTLPHLTSAIERIVVSPHGASYAVVLANNSIMVLSTSELKPTTSIVGLQSRRIDSDQLTRTSFTNQESFDILRRIPAAVSPQDVSRVIFSVPSSQESGPCAEPYIQTYDVAAHQHISRQAVTRNNATDLNTGPDRAKIHEPSVKYLQLSNDGNWMATIDEWIPPRSDLGSIDEGIPEFNEEERSFRREVHLKFWRWNKQTKLWSLDSRIDTPHALDTLGAAARVLDLVSRPTSVGFATIGEDGFVRIWEPKTQLGSGVVLRGVETKKQDSVVTWSLHRAIELGSGLDVLSADSDLPSLQSSRNACLAYSQDGSVLAAGVSVPNGSDPGVIHIIASESGEIRRSITELDSRGLARLGFVDNRYLISVGDSIVIWDLVIDMLVFCKSLDDLVGIDVVERAWMVNLAINDLDHSFAVSCPIFEKQEKSVPKNSRLFRKVSTRLFIVDPKRPNAMWTTLIQEVVVLALLPSKNGRGFIALDASSSIRFITPRAGPLGQIAAAPEKRQLQITGQAVDDEMDLDDEDDTANGILRSLPGLTDPAHDDENDKPVVRPEQLQEIFEGGHGLPPVRDLFNRVVDLYARKPRAV
jgi:NET1-associated nuclear protein 1 (U3 small nucleolar RNA-associated protein 17)